MLLVLGLKSNHGLYSASVEEPPSGRRSVSFYMYFVVFCFVGEINKNESFVTERTVFITVLNCYVTHT